MVYLAPFHRVVLIGTLYSDTFNTTVSMIPSGGGTLPAVTDDLVEAVGTFAGTWFQRPMNVTVPYGPEFSSMAVLQSVKVNRIGVDGKYQDAEAKEYALPIPLPGSHSIKPPAQLSAAVTLRGTNERARAGRGRMFMPPSSVVGTMGTDGRIPEVAAGQYANGASALIAGLNDVYLTEGVNAVAGIASNVGAGAFQTVVRITVGRTVDTMRSRRNKIPEDFVEATAF